MSIKFVNAQVKKILSSYLYNHTITGPTTTHNSFPPPIQYLQDGSRNLPALDRFLRSYFNSHKYLGSSQRSSIVQRVYGMVKYEYLLAHLTKTSPFDLTRQYKYDNYLSDQLDYKIQLFNSNDFYDAINNTKIPKYISPHIFQILKGIPKQIVVCIVELEFLLGGRFAFRCMDQFWQLKMYPQPLYLVKIGNEDKAYQISKIMNQRAPLTLRYNPIKTTRHAFINRMQTKYKLRLYPCQYAQFGLKLVTSKQISLLQTEEFQEGLFEIQDQGSQLCALQTKCNVGELVLDYCGGSGGKSLAIAHRLAGKGQIFIHQPREVALQKAKKRFARAGIQNVQFHSNEQKMEKVLLGKADWIIVDAPCTGTGTLRRNPDLKLKFCQDLLKKNQILQQEIMARSLKYLSKNGRVVYITCSLLKQQNQDQVKRFQRAHGLQVQNGQIMQILPQKDGTDGFFAVVLKKR